MNLWKRVQDVIKTAVSDLFSEEIDETEPLSLYIHQTQTRLNELQDELAQAVAREKRAETAWKTTQDESKTDELVRQHQTFVQVTASLQNEIERLQTRLSEIHKQTGQLNEREQSVWAMERLQQLRQEINKTADSLHTSLEEQTEQIARREDKIAAREELNDLKRSLF